MDTEILRPNAAGAETSIDRQQPDETYHWDKVGEDPLNDATYVWTLSATYLRDLYNLPAHSVGSGTINSIKIYFRLAGAYGYPVNAKPSLKSNDTVTDGTEVSQEAGFVTYSQTWVNNPADGEAWEWADIDALQIGLQLKDPSEAVGAACSWLYVEIDYTPVVAGRSFGYIIG